MDNAKEGGARLFRLRTRIMSIHNPGSRLVAEAFSASGRKRKRRKAKVSDRGQGEEWLLTLLIVLLGDGDPFYSMPPWAKTCKAKV